MTQPPLSEDQLDKLIQRAVRHAVRDELRAAGLRIDDEDHVDEARADFMFLRKVRQAFNGAASKVGGAVILAFVGGVVWLLTAGVQSLLPPK